MQIGMLASRAGVPVDTVRYYERVRSALYTVAARCPGHGASSACPILAALAED